MPGREAAAIQNMADAQTYFEKLATDEKCETCFSMETAAG